MTTSTASPLDRAFEPFQLAGLTLRNRFIKAATFEGRTPGGRPGVELARFQPVAQRRPLGPGDGINAYGLFSGVPFSGTMRQDDFDAALPSSNLRTSTADGRGLDRPASSRHRR